MSLETVPLRQVEANLVFTFSYTGNLSPEPLTYRLYNDTGKARKITKVRASVGTAPTGSPVVVDVLRNGVSLPLQTSGARGLSIPQGLHTAVTQDITLDWLQDQYLTVSILQIGSDTPGADLTINVVVSE